MSGQNQKPKTIAELKADKIAMLQTKFNSQAMRERLVHIAKGDESLVVTNLNSFFTIITNDEGSGKEPNKKFLCMASTSSLALCFMESMQIGIPIDRRGLVHIVVYGLQAELEIDYRGFIYYLSKHYTDADFDIKLVYDGDTFNHWSDSGDDKYEYRKNPDRKVNDYGKVIWAFCYMTYVKNGRERSKIEVMDKRELDLVKSKAKTQTVWGEWTGEMYKKAVVRRACKLPLASVDENAIESVDNKNFELDRPATADRLQLLMQTQEEMINEKKPEPKKDAAAGAGNTETPGGTVQDGGGNNEPPPVGQDDPLADDDQANTPPADAGGTGEQAAEVILEGAAGGAPENEGMVIEHDPSPVLPAENYRAEWDGETIIIGGKEQVKDFQSPAAALNYLKKVMESRRQKLSRKKLIEENPLLMAALIKSGMGSSIAELHKIADAGV